MAKPPLPPLYPSEAELGRLVLGERAKEWPGMAQVLERQGLPPIDKMMGGRHWESVQEFFRLRSGPRQTNVLPFAPDGEETPDAEKAASARRLRTDRRDRGARPQASPAR